MQPDDQGQPVVPSNDGGAPVGNDMPQDPMGQGGDAGTQTPPVSTPEPEVPAEGGEEAPATGDETPVEPTV